MRAARPRKLHRDHFAFMRAVIQGVDLRVSWDRYLRIEGAHGGDVRAMPKTIRWIRDEFAAAARRHQRPGTARLVLLDAEQLEVGAAQLPSLEEFAAAHGMEDFSAAEQAEAYAEAFGEAAAGNSRRRRVMDRQLEALRWLEGLVAQDPQAGDAVSSWLAPALADRLERAGIPTLFALVERINAIGARWWGGVPGIGATKGERILEWLRAHEASIGVAVGPHVAKKRTALLPAELDLVVPPATALVPLEKFLTPSALNGSAGRFRAPRELCVLTAENDHQAIAAWLASKKGSKTPGALSPTQRSYRKEAERLLLWAVLERKKPLSSLTLEDAIAYAAFLEAPPAGWCGPRHQERWSPLWRPLEGPLTGSALRLALTIVRSLYAFLVEKNYLVANPFAGVAKPADSRRVLGSSRSLTTAQWEVVKVELQEGASTAAERRVHRAVRWLYATGLRQAELLAACCRDLASFEYRTTSGAAAVGWQLTVIGKGERERQVPVPANLVAELAAELQLLGRTADVTAKDNADVPILASFVGADRAPSAWSAPGLYKALKKFFAARADELTGDDATRMRNASAHWLRHTHGTHATNGRAGRKPMDIKIVRNNMGHASIATTSGYLTTERDARIQAMEEFWAEE